MLDDEILIRENDSLEETKKYKTNISFSAENSEKETEILRKQIEQLPPEVAKNGDENNTCVLCTSIIYRPLFNSENL